MDAQKSALVAKLKGKSAVAFERAKSMERQLGGKRLPGGLVDAVCRFSGYDLAETDNGTPYIMVRGVCIEPSRYKGARVTQSVFLADSEFQTEAEAYNQLMSILEALGKPISGADFEGMINLLEELTREKPLCRFNTSTRANRGGYYNPSFQGLVDSAGSKVTETEEEEEQQGEEVQTESLEVGQRVSVEWEDGEVYSGAIQALSPGAVEVKFDDGTVSNVPIGDIRLAEEQSSEGSEDYVPAEGDIVRCGGVKGRPECEVLKVDAEKKTVVLRAKRTKTVYEDVEWSRLIVE